jgi:selenium metabolism protein YedF
MEKTLDCRGLACPMPVLRTKECLEADHPDTVVVTVDNQAARENVDRFLSRAGYAVSATEAGGGIFTLTATRSATAPPSPSPAQTPEPAASDPGDAKTLVLITADTIGRGDPTLGAKLMVNFCATLPELGDSLWRIILLNGGVKLSVADSPVLASLRQLAEAGVSILVCGTCLDFFGLLEQKNVGETTNMLDVVTSLALADKVIQI